MNKNASNLYPFAIQDQLSNGLTGQTPSVFLRQDNGSFAAASGSVTEIDSTNYPGLYQITLTATECNCNVLTIAVSLPDGQEPVILDVVYPVTTGGATPQQIWEYAGGRTVTNTIPTASDNATAVWGAQTKEVTIATAQADTFATASALTTVGNNVSAVKAKTDALPEHPAAVGSEMALTSAAIAAAQSGLATSDALSTVDGVVDAIKAKTDNLPQSPAAVGSAMTLTSETVTSIKNGLATGGGLEALASYGDNHWTTADVSDLAKTSDVSSAQTALTALINSVLSGIFHWQVEGSILTIYNASNVAIGAYTLTKDSSGNITAVTPIVQPEPETNNAE